MYKLLHGKEVTVQDWLAVASILKIDVDSGLHIFGWRNSKGSADRFEDCISIGYKEFDSYKFKTFKATTYPGRYWLEHLMNSDGTAVLLEGHYRDVYRVGLHKGKEALVQCGPMTVARDTDLDDTPDIDEMAVQTGVFGINIHRAGLVSEYVGKWSAGCQVISREADFTEFMSIVKGFEKAGQTRFSYTLVRYCYGV